MLLVKDNRNIEAFISLVTAGLWEKEIQFSAYDDIDYDKLFRLAEEQTVTGLVAAGLEHCAGVTIPKGIKLSFIGEALRLEQRNTEMNGFISELIRRFNYYNIRALIVKGQGVAQCYEKPLWRVAGDVDLLLSRTDYKRAKVILTEIASSINKEDEEKQHLAMTVEQWIVELHGTLRAGIGKKVDRMIDSVQECTFTNNEVRVWDNNGVNVFLPSPDNDVLFVFTHFLEHFFRGGVGLRQVCDWCRLLWKYKEIIDVQLLYSRLRKAGLLTEWRAFAYLAVKKLGFPEFSMPLYDDNNHWQRKVDRILSLIIEAGNMGHNRDYSYKQKKSFLARKSTSFFLHTKDWLRQFSVFPRDSFRVWCILGSEGIMRTIRRM